MSHVRATAAFATQLRGNKAQQITGLDFGGFVFGDTCHQTDFAVRYRGENHHRFAQFVFQLVNSVAQGFGISPFQMRRKDARMVIKDPIALFSADWIARRFGAKVVVLVRHPAGFVASMQAAGFKMNFEAFSQQPALMEGRLAPFADEIRAAPHLSPSIEANTLLWRILHHHIDLLAQEHPDWIFVRHEDLSRDPETAFPPLFERLGLPFTDEVRAGLTQFTSDQSALGRFSLFGTRRRTMRSSTASMRSYRSRLTPEEIATIRRLASPIWERFYDASDW